MVAGVGGSGNRSSEGGVERLELMRVAREGVNDRQGYRLCQLGRGLHGRVSPASVSPRRDGVGDALGVPFDAVDHRREQRIEEMQADEVQSLSAGVTGPSASTATI